jgi:hypothetical protein
MYLDKYIWFTKLKYFIFKNGGNTIQFNLDLHTGEAWQPGRQEILLRLLEDTDGVRREASTLKSSVATRTT